MWTRSVPPVVAGEEHVEVLDPADRDEMVAFLERAQPAHPRAAVRPAGAALGRPCATTTGRWSPSAAASRAPRARPRWPASRSTSGRRGAGWGAAVTAHLTRLAVDETGACALGMFADNDVARRLYHRLGYTTGMEWTSRWFGA